MDDSSSPSHHSRRLFGSEALDCWSSPSLAAQHKELTDGRLGTVVPTPPYVNTAAGGPANKLLERPAAGGSSPFTIHAYAGSDAAAASNLANSDASISKASAVQDALQADYRSQLKQYVSQLAAKENEVTTLRQQVVDLKRQLGSSVSGLQDSNEAANRSAAQAAHLEKHVLGLEQQLQQREQEVAQGTRQRQALEQEAAAAKAQVAAIQKGVASKATDWEDSRKHYKEQLELKDAHIKRLEETVQKQSAEAERKAREWSQREVDLSVNHAQNKDSAAALRSQLSMAQDKLEQALKRAKTAESTGAELRRQRAQMLADMKMLEDLLADSDNERREMHEKYVVMGERMEALVREEHAVREAAQMESEAARLAVQEAVRDAESAVKERASLQKLIKDLREQLEAEQASRGRLADKVQRKLAAVEQEVNYLKTELESKIKQLKASQADMKALHSDAESKLDACEAQMSNLKNRITSLTRELDQEKKRTGQVKEETDAIWQERVKVEQQQQALRYERRIQELEVQYHSAISGSSGLVRGSCAVPAVSAAAATGGPPATTLLDYIPRSEHVRVLESRLSAKESDMTVELNSRVNQTEREWQWKVEGKEQEISSLNNRLRQLEDDLHSERQRSGSHTHKLSDENKRLQAQCVELQRDLDAAQKELTRLKETLKDARVANAGMDDDQLLASRQVARLKHALDDSHTALQEAQQALEKERKRSEGCCRELDLQKGRLDDAYRKVARVEGEVAELTSALEQKQEVVAALQGENAGCHAKIMAHREWHDQEMDGLRKQLRQECDEKVGPLEQQCLALAVEVRELKQRHQEKLTEQEAQHAAQVAQLEKQLAAAERCNAELKQLSSSLGSVRQDDVEVLKGHVQDLKLQLKEAHQQRSKERREHQAQLAALETQIKAKLTAFKSQHKLFRTQVQGDILQTCSDCLHDYEAGLAALKQQLLDSSGASAQAQEVAAGRIARLKDSLTKLFAILSEHCTMPAGLDAMLADTTAAAEAAGTAHALQQVAQALQQHVEESAAAAAEAMLLPLEDCLLIEGNFGDEHRVAGGRRGQPGKMLERSRSRSQSPTRRPSSSRLTPSGRQLDVAQHNNAASPEALEARLEMLVGRCHELKETLAANKDQVEQLKAKLAALDAAFVKAKAEGLEAAKQAHDAAVAPLQQEVERMQECVRELQQQYTAEVAAMEAAAKQQVSEVQAQAQRALDQATAQSRQLQRELDSERQKGDTTAAELTRVQSTLTKESQRRASTLEVKDRELSLLKEHIRELERRPSLKAEDKV